MTVEARRASPSHPASAGEGARFLTPSLAQQAARAVQPAIEAQLLRPEVSGLGVLHLVVLDSAPTVLDGPTEPRSLYEHSIGDRARWDVDYADYARRKARLSWRHGMDSRRLQLLQPHRLRSDDSLLWGGVNLDGIVVAASGAFPIWDECFSMLLAVQLRALAWAAADQAR
ncbi:hypothetical protein OU995_21800 [Roseateles sp. SL47]|jgi:hypothetical protein|uniref:hypothetical protein n=1 Tax=Roseateles sp. SL47 TaxID=2995138 RepID=UPI002271F5A6|nr:hypothetical protein [Roseateles sp. SL47]WAC72170.1 hypothetical protein OU995_21800 [Roseateles sp. SL47]